MLSMEDRYFMIPNNVKRLYSMPLTKTLGSHKRKQKQRRRYHATVNQTTFNYVDSLVEKAITDNLESLVGKAITDRLYKFSGEFFTISQC